ncbi:MAG: hypothetical protein E6R08_06715 [Nevskiaceae bacterium]|nr:MAG: hypothetical protein E6R08_06715 [Nevskiaceae bacterium]
MVARVFRKPSLQQEDRLPVDAYEDAIARLVLIRAHPSMTDGAYDLIIKLTADIYWLNDLRVRRDVMIASREIGGF